MEQQVQIQLINDNNEIIGYLDVKEGTVFPLTYSISEIRDISKKKGTTSKSITLSGTKNNNILLNNYYDANIQAGTFDVNQLQIVNVIQNGISILDNAVMQLVSVNKTQENSNHEDSVTYTVLIKDKTSDFFTNINNKYLTDLSGFDWMNHKYTADNVIASFNNTVENGYKYIMPYNPGAPEAQLDDTLFDLTEFAPGIYAKTYFDKIFSNAGFSYYWPDKDNDDIQFSKLIIPYNGDRPKITTQESAEFNVDVYRTGTTIGTSTYGSQSTTFGGIATYTIKDSLPFQITFPFEYSDPAGLFNTSTSIYTTPQVPSTTNNIAFEYEVDYEIVVVNPGATAYLKSYSNFNGNNNSFQLNLQAKVLVKKNTVSVYSNDVIGNVNLPTSSLNSYPNGTTVVKTGTTTIQKTIPGIDPDQPIKLEALLDINSTTNLYMFKSTNSALMNGNNRENVSIQLKIKGMRLKFKPYINGSYGYNVPVSMSRYIPEKIKQSDFVKSIFTMFNLYAEVNKQNPNRIDIKGRNAYYDEGKFNDWTNKLIKDKDQELKFIPEISNKKMLMTYKEDKDIANEIYKQATGEIYGQQEFIFDNEFVRDTTKQEIIFSPTPMFNTKFGAVSPMWLGGAPKCNIRILLDGGEYPTTATYTIYDYNFPSGSNKAVTNNTYPHVSHWNKPVNPTFDINFGVCDYYFRSDNYGANTNNNLFNLHWRRTLNQINSGKLLTAYFNLSENDIFDMRLSDKIRIDNSWWNINKIQDYDANSTNPTKVELISIDDNLEMPFETRVVSKIEAWDDVLVIPRTWNGGRRDKFLSTILSETDVDVRGVYNYIGPDVTSATVQGDSNFISENTFVVGDNNNINSENTYIFGNDNTTTGGTGTYIFGNGITGSSDNTVYVSNLVIPSGGTINGSSAAGLGVNYVRGWEVERELGNTITIGKGKGKLLLTSGSTIVQAAEGADFSLNNFDSPLFRSTGTVFLSDGTPRFIFFNNFSGSTACQIDSIHIDNNFLLPSLGNIWTGETGNYEFYSYWLPQVSNWGTFAIGEQANANGSISMAIGYGAEANGDRSLALAPFSTANGFGSIAMGNSAKANGDSSIAMGNKIVANGNYSYVGGLQNSANTQSETVIGQFATAITGSSSTFVTTEPIFRVGIGTFGNNKDAVRFYKNGAMYMYPTPLSGITNGANGFFAYNDTNKRLAGHNGTTWSNYQTAEDTQKKQNLPTGFVTGLTLSINADNTKFDIASGAYVITDFSNIANITTQIIQLTSPMTGITPTYLTTTGVNATYVALNSASTVVMQASPFTNEQRRSLAILGAVIHSNHININTTNEIKAPIIAPTNQLHDFMRAIGSLNLEGNVFSANGANLSLNKSAGVIFGLGINGGDYLNPHQLSLSAQTALTFRYRLSNGVESGDTTTLNPLVYESSTGVLTALSNNNRWSVQHVNIFQSGIVRIQYGQHEYSTFTEAQGNMFTESFNEEQNIAENSIFRAYVILKKTTTNLAADIAAGTAAIVSVDKFGNTVGGPGNSLTSAAIIAALGYTPSNDANVVHKTGNETVAGQKDFSDAILKTVTSGGGTSGGGFTIGNVGQMYDRFDFISRDDVDSDGFGQTALSLNPEEGINLSHANVDNDIYSALYMSYNSCELTNYDNGKFAMVKPDALNQGVIISGELGKNARLGTSNISAATTRDFAFPNQSGTLALLSDITGSTLQTVTNVGASTTNTLSLNSGFTSNIANATRVTQIDANTANSLIISNGLSNPPFLDRPASITLLAASANTANSGIGLAAHDTGGSLGNTAWLRTDNLTAQRNIQFPNASGTLSVIGTTAPASASATGTVGEIRITSTFIYTCIATNTWVRGAMATW